MVSASMKLELELELTNKKVRREATYPSKIPLWNPMHSSATEALPARRYDELAPLLLQGMGIRALREAGACTFSARTG